MCVAGKVGRLFLRKYVTIKSKLFGAQFLDLVATVCRRDVAMTTTLGRDSFMSYRITGEPGR